MFRGHVIIKGSLKRRSRQPPLPSDQGPPRPTKTLRSFEQGRAMKTELKAVIKLLVICLCWLIAMAMTALAQQPPRPTPTMTGDQVVVSPPAAPAATSDASKAESVKT